MSCLSCKGKVFYKSTRNSKMWWNKSTGLVYLVNKEFYSCTLHNNKSHLTNCQNWWTKEKKICTLLKTTNSKLNWKIFRYVYTRLWGGDLPKGTELRDFCPKVFSLFRTFAKMFAAAEGVPWYYHRIGVTDSSGKMTATQWCLNDI